MFSDTGQLEYSNQAGGGGAPDNKCYTDTDTDTNQPPAELLEKNIRGLIILNMFISCFMFTLNYAHE